MIIHLKAKNVASYGILSRIVIKKYLSVPNTIRNVFIQIIVQVWIMKKIKFLKKVIRLSSLAKAALY